MDRTLRAIAEAHGCRVLSASEVTVDGRTYPVLELDCGTNERAVAFLGSAARLYNAHDPEIRMLALTIARAHPAAIGRAIHAFVKVGVRFVREKRETFQHARLTLRMRAGDCDDHARCVAALATAAGLKARIEPVRNTRGAISHVCAQLFEGGAWRWAETTIDAEYGEAPRDAAKRLRVQNRADVVG
jgi:transglutaminase-like putative cysteine protease